MPNKSYVRGRAKEERAVKEFKTGGADATMRAAASKGLFDVIGIWKPDEFIPASFGRIVLRQCKTGKKAESERARIRNELKRFEGTYKVEVVVD